MGKNSQKKDDDVAEIDYILYAEIPKSSIIYNEHSAAIVFLGNVETENHGVTLEIGDHKFGKLLSEMAHKLHSKYIAMDAALEVNISSSLRSKYKAMDIAEWKMDAWELFLVFDPLIKEMSLLMLQSYIRY